MPFEKFISMISWGIAISLLQVLIVVGLWRFFVWIF